MRILFRRMQPKKFSKKWTELQKLCARKETWPQAIARADKLLDQALKKKRMKGKSIGERLVSAQRLLSNNDGVWYAHNLAKKVAADSGIKVRETAVKKALVGFRQALRDLGALNDQ